MSRRILHLLFLAAILGISSHAQVSTPTPATYYVSPAGRDGNSGSAAAPFLTLQHAIDVALPGGTVIALEGQYAGQGNRNLNFHGKAITLQSRNPADPVCVKATVIDAQGEGVIARFVNDEGPGTVFAGFTLLPGDRTKPVPGVPGYFEVLRSARPTTAYLRVEGPPARARTTPMQTTLESIPSSRVWDGSNPFFQPASTADYYGSGDVDGDGAMTSADIVLAQQMASGTAPGSPRADVNGDGVIDSSDVAMISSAIGGGEVLPAWWNRLTTREQRIDWVHKIFAVDRTDLHPYLGWYDCHAFAIQAYIHAVFYRNDLSVTFFSGGQTHFNVPMYVVQVTTPQFLHYINAILVGDDPLKFADWLFMEPQTDMEVRPGMWDMPNDADLQFEAPLDIAPGWQITSTLLTISTSSTGSLSAGQSDPKFVLVRPAPPVVEPDSRPDLWEPRIVGTGNGLLFLNRLRSDMSYMNDIVVTDLPFVETAPAKPLVLDPEYSYLLDSAQAPDGTVHLVWKGGVEYVPTLFHGTLDLGTRTLRNTTQIRSGLCEVRWSRTVATATGETHVFWYAYKRNVLYTCESGIYWSKWQGSGWQTEELLAPVVPWYPGEYEGYDSFRNLFDATATPDGRIYLVWIDNGVLWQRVYDGAWSAQSDIETTGMGSGGVDLAMGSDGALHLAYWLGGQLNPTSGVDGRGNLYHRQYTGSTWSAADTVDATGGASWPQMAAAPGGTIYLVWTRKVGSQSLPVWKQYAAGGWGAEHVLPVRTGASAFYPSIATLLNSQVVVAWSSRSTDRVTIETADITPAVPSLSITNSHTGNFRQGQAGAVYTLAVTNAAGAATTSGTVTVTDTVPAGLTLVAMSGTDWVCSIQSSSCTRNDARAGGASYPPITVTVNVAANATSPQNNSATVSGGGSAPASATDPTTIIAAADLRITKAHTGNFTQGQQNATYTVTVSNEAGAGPTTGPVTMTETLPAGLNLVSMMGADWDCPAGAVTCTRSDVLNPGASYPAITVTVNVASNAPGSVTNIAAVSGGGDITVSNNTANDPTTVGTLLPILTMAGCWTFDTITGNQAPDCSGNGLTGTVSNAAAVAGRINQALSFSGANSYVAVPDSSGLRLSHDLTLMTWIRTTNSSEVQNFVGKYDYSGSETGYLLQILPSGVVNLHLGGNNIASGSRDAPDITRINDGEWHHVAVVIGVGLNPQLYIDGKLSSTSPQIATAGGTLTPVYLGTFPGAYNGKPFTGSLDEVRIYSRRLSTGEILAILRSAAATITKLTPETSPAGNSFTLTVEGTGFLPSAVVVAEVPLSRPTVGILKTEYKSSTRLIAEVPRDVLMAPGTVPVRVFNVSPWPAQPDLPDPAGSNSKDVTITPVVPAISNLTPSALHAGGPDFTLTVDGSGFIEACSCESDYFPGAVVLWNGTPLTGISNVVNSTRITVPVSASRISAPGPATITVRNPGGVTSTPVTLDISSTLPLSLTCTNPSMTVQPGVPYTSTCSVSGGTPPYRWDRSDFAPPLTVSGNTATLSVTPYAGYQLGFTIFVSDSTPSTQRAEQYFFLTVAPTLTCTPAAGPAQIGLAYSSTCTVANGGAPFTWSVGAGTLPAGISLTVSGGGSGVATVSGTPSALGSYAYTITATDSMNPANKASQSFSGTISAGSVTPPPAAGYWTFDTSDISGSQVLDRSGNGLTGTLSNAASVPGRTNQAFSFSGAGSYVTIPDNVSLRLTHDLTLTAWIKTTNTTQTQNFIGKYDFSGQETGYLLQILPAGFVNLHLGGNNVASGSRDARDNTAINDGTWHHVAVVITPGQNVQFYIDGNLTSTQSQIAAPAGTLAPLYLGTSPGAYNGQPFTGSLDEVRIYGRALTAAEILSVSGGPAPVITKLDPSAAPQATAFTVTVNGRGFEPNAVVLVVPDAFTGPTSEVRAKAILPTAFQNATLLTATVPRDFIMAPGTITLQVLNGFPGGVGSNIAPYTITPLVPTISKLDPVTITAGGPDFLLAVEGSNFIPECMCVPDFVFGSQIAWNGQPLRDTTYTPTKLTATIPASYIASAATASITVVNPGSVTSTATTLTIASTPSPLALSCTPPPVTAAPWYGVGNATVQPGVPYTGTCKASGGTPPYSWDVSELPPPHSSSGDTFTYTVTLNTAVPHIIFTVWLRDSGGSSALTRSLFFAIPPVLSCVPSTGPAQAGVAWSSSCSVLYGGTGYTWSITAGVLPAGISLTPGPGDAAAATISGAATAPGPYSYTVSASDNMTPPNRVSQTFSGTIAPLPSALAGCWLFDTVTGNQTPDCSGNGVSGTLYNATSAPGKVNQALSFSGAGSYVVVPDGPGLQLTHDLTLAAFIKTTNNTQTQDFLSKYDFTGSETGYMLQMLPSGVVNLHVGGNNLLTGGRDVRDSRIINDGQWHHVAVVLMLGSNIRIYIDGQLSSTQALQTAAARNTAPLYLGTFPGAYGGGLPFLGSLDEVRIYSVPMSDSEIAALAAAGGPVPITVSVAPPSVSLGPGQTQPFTATVTGTANSAVNWTIFPTLGSISGAGLYTAPATISTQQNITVTATSQADSGKAAQATVTLVPSVSIPAAGHWTFDTIDINGSLVLDRSGNGLAGTLVNAAVVSGKINQALRFAGAGSYVSIPDNAGLSLAHDLTLSAWIQTTNTAEKQNIISKYDFSGPETGYMLQILPAGQVNLRVGGNNLLSGSSDASDTTSINDGQWHHVAIVITLGQDVKFYIDGRLSSTLPMRTTAHGIGAPLYLGTFPGTYNGRPFTGALDDVWVCSRALSTLEIATLAAGGGS